MNDLKPFEHGEEGTHGACDEMIKKYGGKAKCCECEGHKCKEQSWEKKFDKLELFDLETGSGKWDRKLALDFIHSNFIEKKRIKELLSKRKIGGTYFLDTQLEALRKKLLYEKMISESKNES